MTALDKADAVDESTLSERCDAVADVVSNPVPISALEDEDLSALTERLLEVLHDLERATVELPLCDEATSLVSWLHDAAATVTVEYGSERVVVEFAAQSATVAKANARAAELEEPETADV